MVIGKLTVIRESSLVSQKLTQREWTFKNRIFQLD